MFQVGDRVGDYEILHVLGAGGMGQVYKVRNTLSDRIEAMKVLLPGLVGDAQLADRFLREIKVQASLIHKNIAQLYTAQRNGDQILMLLEFVDGVTLDTLMKRGAMTSQATVEIFTQVLDALTFAHARGVVHRDIKPQNIMVTADGTAKLMDFGIARMAADKKLTQTGRTLGSLYYMSPEQIRGADDIDGRSDIYSLGITLYEAATGSRPFEGDSDYTIMAAHLQQPPVPPVDRDPRLPRALSDVILAAIEKDREQRFQKAEAFKAALGHINGGGGSFVPPPPRHAATIVGGPGVRAATTPITNTPPPQQPQAYAPQPPPQPQQAWMPPPPQPPPRKSSAGLFMALGALAFAALGGLGYWQYPRIFGEKPAVEDKEKKTLETSGGGGEPKPADPKPAGPQPPVGGGGSTPPVIERKPEPPIVAGGGGGGGGTPQRPQPQDPQPQRPEPQLPVGGGGGGGAKQLQDPPIDPAVARELEGLRQQYNQLAIRLGGCKESMASIEAQQRQMGLGLRGDVKDAARNAELKMREGMNALRNKDVESARNDLEAAERMVDFVAKAVGR